MFGDGDAGHCSRCGFDLAANLAWCGWFRVEGFDVRRAAVIKDQDARLGLAEAIAARRRRGCRPSLEPVRPNKPGESKTANLHRLAPREAVAEANAGMADRKHNTTGKDSLSLPRLPIHSNKGIGRLLIQSFQVSEIAALGREPE